MAGESTLVLWNASAGSASRAEDVLKEFQSDHRAEIVTPESREQLMATIRERGGDFSRVVAAGGDGTVNAAISALVEAELKTPLGIIPLGTGNDLARGLDIPLDPLAAWELVDHSGEPRGVDVVHFRTATHTGISANMLTGGNTGKYLDAMTDEMKQRWGAYCYLRGVIDVLRDMETYNIQLTYENGRTEMFDVINFFLANGRTSGGGLSVAPEALMDDGLCDLVLVKEGTSGEIVGLAADYLLDQPSFQEHDLVETRRVSELIVSSDRELPLTADGELIGHTPLRIRVIPRGVKIIAGVTTAIRDPVARHRKRQRRVTSA